MIKRASQTAHPTMAMDCYGIKPKGPRPTPTQLAATRQTYIVNKSGTTTPQTQVVVQARGRSK